MAKSLRSKIKRRWRKLKRGKIDEVIEKPKLEKLSKKLEATIIGIEIKEPEIKNAFLFPNDPTSAFPQFIPTPILDLRSSAIAGSGNQWSGANRKSKHISKQKTILAKDLEVEVVENTNEIQEEKPHILIQRKYLNKNKRTSKLRKTIVF